jgi:Ca2+/H+ antiporter
MLIMAMIGCLIPTLFYHIMGKYDMSCINCDISNSSSCSGCTFSLKDPTTDSFYLEKLRPLMYLSAAVLPSAYFVGLFFSLRTHKFHIYDRKSSIQQSLHGSQCHYDEQPGSIQAIGSEAHSSSMNEVKSAPTWSKTKSGIVLLISTVLFSVVAGENLFFI